LTLTGSVPQLDFLIHFVLKKSQSGFKSSLVHTKTGVQPVSCGRERT
jgi:hypothetical protein